MPKNPKNQITRILNNLDLYIAKTHGANGLLASMFRQMLKKLNITGPRWGMLMNEYINNPHNQVPAANQKDRTSMRGNLTKEFSKPQMTWKVFCKGLRFLQIVKFEMIIVATHGTGRRSVHRKTVNLGRHFASNELVEDLQRADSEDDQEAAQLEDTLGQIDGSFEPREYEPRPRVQLPAAGSHPPKASSAAEHSQEIQPYPAQSTAAETQDTTR